MNKFEETRNREIKDAFKSFAEHQATLKQYGELEILDWRRPGTGWYRVRYVFDRESNRIYISGDLGEAVVWPTWPATLANTCINVCSGKWEVNECYFLEKVAATSNRYVWDKAEAEAEVKNRCPDIDEWDLEMVMEDFDDRCGLTHIGDRARGILNDIYSEYWEWIGDAGRSISGRVYLWLIGMKMAWQQIQSKGNESEPAR